MLVLSLLRVGGRRLGASLRMVCLSHAKASTRCRTVGCAGFRCWPLYGVLSSTVIYLCRPVLLLAAHLGASLAFSDDLFAVYIVAWRESALAPDARKQLRSVEHCLCSDTCGYPCPTDPAFRCLLPFEESLRQITKVTSGKDHNHEAQTEGYC